MTTIEITKPIPPVCDCCQGKIGKVFYDARLPGIGWCDCCHDCFTSRNGRLGLGFGQKYEVDRTRNIGVKVLKAK